MDRLFEKFQQKDPSARRATIRLIDRHVNIDSLVKSLSEQVEPLREQNPFLLHIDTAGVSIQALVSPGRLLEGSKLCPNAFL